VNKINFLIITAFLVTGTPLAAGTLTVRDADTIVVDGTAVRLNGVDAPELNTQPGKSARRWLVNFLAGKTIECELSGTRTHDRWVGICYADGLDIGAAVIAAGHALDCYRYSGGRYRHLETSAARARLPRARYC
jgi:endonuclease YncB( thermonuclease family)